MPGRLAGRHASFLERTVPGLFEASSFSLRQRLQRQMKHAGFPESIMFGLNGWCGCHETVSSMMKPTNHASHSIPDRSDCVPADLL